jgi:hypothetical protein
MRPGFFVVVVIPGRSRFARANPESISQQRGDNVEIPGSR